MAKLCRSPMTGSTLGIVLIGNCGTIGMATAYRPSNSTWCESARYSFLQEQHVFILEFYSLTESMVFFAVALIGVARATSFNTIADAITAQRPMLKTFARLASCAGIALNDPKFFGTVFIPDETVSYRSSEIDTNVHLKLTSISFLYVNYRRMVGFRFEGS